MDEKTTHILSITGIVLLSFLVMFSSLQILSVSAALGGKKVSVFNFGGSSTVEGKGVSFKVKSGGDTVQNVIEAMVAKGIPVDYGEELALSFDDPVPGLSVLAKLDRQISTESLTPDEKARFVNITTKISCEFCCGVPAVSDQSGRATCGCSHALSFRGLAKYIVKNHGDTWEDEQILMELTKWKTLYYPKNMVEKGVAAAENNLELTPAVLNDRQLLQKLKTGQASSAGINDLPTMVGGC